MESGVFLSCLDQFMLSPLVSWVKTFMPDEGSTHLDFSELTDGVFLNEIMAQINPSATPQGVHKVCKHPSERIQNLNFLVQQIKTYYLDNLRQLIMTPLPDVLVLGQTPCSEQSLDEMKKLLLLLLGCAVQCEKKEDYIEMIQTLDFDTKAAIAAHIQELNHNRESVLDLQWLDSNEIHPTELEVAIKNMATLFRHLLEQRDTHLETIAELMQEKEESMSFPTSSQSSSQSAGSSDSLQQQPTETQQHLVVELADSKAKIRRLRQELEEKSEQMLDYRHELENVEVELKKIQQENSQLLVDARAARAYRDELDALRERAIKADKLESEVGRYREQLHKMEFYKAKVEDLREDNRVLQETKEVLEEQLEGYRTRTDKNHHLEKQNLLLKTQIHEMEQEREVDQKRIEELQAENLSLCLAQRRSMDESQQLGWELEQLSRTSESSQGLPSLSEEVSERTHSSMLKLEKENQTLRRTLEELQMASENNNAELSHHAACAQNNFPAAEEMLVTLSQAEEVYFTDDLELCVQEKRQLEDGDHGEHFNEMISDLPILEKNSNELHCVGSCDACPDPNRNEPRQDSISPSSSFASKQIQRLDAKYKALHTYNQQLQASLESTGRKAQHLEAEVEELEAENQSLQASLEELRITAKRLEQLEMEKQNLEQEIMTLEREKKQLEKENRRLQQRTEVQEDRLDSSNLCLAGLDKDIRSLNKELEGLRETEERVKSLESENKELAMQAAIDQQTLSNLHQELVSEKLKCQEKDNELQRLTRELELKVLNQEREQVAQQEILDSSRFKMLESEFESSLKKSLQIKADKMVSLEARLHESSSMNQQLRQELKTMMLSYEVMLQKNEEETEERASNPPIETDNAKTDWQRESQEATKELLRLKDRLIEVERMNATLEAERQGNQTQLKQLESQTDSQQAQILALQRQAASLQESNTALQTNNANLQVEKSTLNSQSASLMAQNAQLQQQQSGTASERDGAVREREELRSVHEQLLRDHERLAVLHERQAVEYETLIGKHACVKKAHRTQELEHRTLQDRYNNLLQHKAKLEDQDKRLNEEKMRMTLEKEQHQKTAAECCKLREEKDWLNQLYRQVLNDNEALTADHKQLKTQLNEIKLEHTWLEADFSKLKKEFQHLDIASTKLSNQCELLTQLKRNLEEENRHLIGQIETLMLQNRTLLDQNMESKDLFHTEEQQYIDKLNDLRRQKEKLEEKIMDQYKFFDPTPPRKRSSWITLKLKKLMKASSRENGSDPSQLGLAEAGLSTPLDRSYISSERCGSSASTLAGYATSHLHDTTSLKKFPHLRNRLKGRDKVKSLFRRSFNRFEGSRWANSSDLLEGPRVDVEKGQKKTLNSSLTTSILSNLHFHHRTTAHTVPNVSGLWVTDKDSNDSAMPSEYDDSDEQQSHASNKVQSRAQSESSCEFNLSLENEPWSNSSSPVQQASSRRSSASCQTASNVSTAQLEALHQQKEKFSIPSPDIQSSTIPQKQKDPGTPQDFWLTRGTKTIRRGSRKKMACPPSNLGDSNRNASELNGTMSKAETTRASACTPITVLYVQGKSSSMSGCLNCFTTPLAKEGRLKGLKSLKSLPHASCVNSTAEGPSRHSSVSSECRGAVITEHVRNPENIPPEETSCQSGEPETDGKTAESDLIPPVKPPRDPAAVVAEHPKSPVQESFLGSSFTFNSVFSNTIFSDSLVTRNSLDMNEMDQNFLYPNSSLLQECSFERQELAENAAKPALSSETEQGPNTENAVQLKGKSQLFITA